MTDMEKLTPTAAAARYRAVLAEIDAYAAQPRPQAPPPLPAPTFPLWLPAAVVAGLLLIVVVALLCAAF